MCCWVEEERVLKVLPSGWVVKVDWVCRKIITVMGWGQYCLEYTYGAYGRRVVVANVKGGRVGGCR